MASASPFRSLTPLVLTALAMWGEGRGETPYGRLAIGLVIRNRVDRRRLSYHDVILAPGQFSCFHPKGGSENYKAVLAQAAVAHVSEPLWQETHWLAGGVVTRILQDFTHGADHYLTTALYKSDKCPSWAKSMTVVDVIGSHTFLRS